MSKRVSSFLKGLSHSEGIQRVNEGRKGFDCRSNSIILLHTWDAHWRLLWDESC